MVLSITTSRKNQVLIQTEAFAQAVRDILAKNVPNSPSDFETVSFNGPNKSIRFGNHLWRKEHTCQISGEKAILLEAWLRQMFPGEFQAVEVAVMATEAQKN